MNSLHPVEMARNGAGRAVSKVGGLHPTLWDGFGLFS